MEMEADKPRYHFKPRARMLLLLGDQLIRDPGVAVFELVKNAFDADSPDATVTMTHVSNPTLGSIVVEDSGTGMDLDTVTNIWLEPGTDFRLKQKHKGEVTPVFKRVPIGEKGVGRFASHKLGKHIRLISRKRNKAEIVVEIDWERDFSGKKYLDQVDVSVLERKAEIFKGDKTGTRIEIEQLRDTWSRGMVRDLARSIHAICSPFHKAGDFKAELKMDDHEEWLKGLLDVKDVLQYALFNARCELSSSALSYKYNFTPYPGMNLVKQRTAKQKDVALKMPKSVEAIDLDSHNIGSVVIDLYIFDREPRVLELGQISDKKGLKEFLDESGGVRVYRGGIRVYDYGERGNDWLGLGGRRVNVPAKRLSNNLIVGAVTLDPVDSINLEDNRGLIEKTNREGFVENSDFEAFRDAVAIAIQNIETERNIDKTIIRKAYSASRLKEPVLEDLTELRELVEQKKMTKELGPYLDRIEADFTAIRDKFLTSASAGLSLSVVIHEVEKGVAELVKAVQAERASDRIKTLAKHLADLIEGFASLVRRSGTHREQASSMIAQALFNIELRLKAHGITPLVKSNQADFEVKCSRRLVVSTIMNLIDNSIYWLDTTDKKQKLIYLGTSDELSPGPAIIVGDNGPGFLDPPEYLTEAFITRKPDGMGLGLHIANEVMKAQKGRLLFPEPDDLELPPSITGAVVALVFGGGKK
jgi:signal transduction histidine kinase